MTVKDLRAILSPFTKLAVIDADLESAVTLTETEETPLELEGYEVSIFTLPSDEFDDRTVVYMDVEDDVLKLYV